MRLRLTLSATLALVPALAFAQSGPSAVLGKTDFTLRSAPACEIVFVYRGMEPENVFWEEPCEAVTAEMVDRSFLEKNRLWDRLEAADQDFVKAMPGGQVLYIEGSFSSSIFPVGTTMLSYEVPLAD